MDHYLDEQTADGFARARNVYEKGAYSGSVATVQVKPLPVAIPIGTKMSAKTYDGESILLTAYNSFPVQATDLKLRYPGQGGCYVGGLHRPHNAAANNTGDQAWKGCLHTTGVITVDSLEVGLEYNYSIAEDNWNDRTIKGFSTSAKTLMRPERNSSANYIEDFQKFVDYYGYDSTT